jgi:hypothetical protein
LLEGRVGAGVFDIPAHHERLDIMDYHHAPMDASLLCYGFVSVFGKVMYPALLCPHCMIPTQGTTFHLNIYVALKFRKLPVISVNRYFCEAE